MNEIKEIYNLTGKDITLFLYDADNNKEKFTIPRAKIDVHSSAIFTAYSIMVDTPNGSRVGLYTTEQTTISLPEPKEGRAYIVDESIARQLAALRDDIYYVSKNDMVFANGSIIGYKGLTKSRMMVITDKTPL